jgi:hypothetical protein
MNDVMNYAFEKAEIDDNHDPVLKKEEENFEFLRKHILYCRRFDPERPLPILYVAITMHHIACGTH